MVAGSFLLIATPCDILSRLLGGIILQMVVVFRHTPRGAAPGHEAALVHPGGPVSGFLAGMVGAVGPLLASFYLGYGLVTAAFIGTSSLSVIIVHLPRLAGYGSLDLTHPRHRCRHRADRFPRGLHREPDATPRICGSFPSIVQIVLIATGILFIVRG